MTNRIFPDRRPIEWWEARQLEAQGCICSDWNHIYLSDRTDLNALRNLTLEGTVSIGETGGERRVVLHNARISNCLLGDRVSIRNVDSIEFEPEANCGLGTEVDVLDETGSRLVRIYPGLSAQTALLMARLPKWREHHLEPILDEYLSRFDELPVIEDDAVIENCGTILNVRIGREVQINGARNLRNGMVINNATQGRALAFVGAGVDAENFILEDGCLDSGAIVRNCYIGQGAILEKGFTAHDSLFFANCSLENGEACALFAGPYTVSMHKSTLLIGCQTSFMNAGSGTNQSNHMYKLGPVHWGILERGVKTASASYLMLGAKIGAFSLLMGQHKTHPDSSQFPFSYLFGDNKGATVVVPGVMLRSCGLLRDEQKWPNRDRRLKRKLPMHDRIVFDVLNPITVDKMLSASEVIETLLGRPTDDDLYIRYKGMRFTRAALERAKYLYALAIYKYLSRHVDSIEWKEPAANTEIEEWVDIAGLPVTRSHLRKVQASESIEEMEKLFDEAFEQYPQIEKAWIQTRFAEKWHKPKEVILEFAAQFDRMIEEDRTRYLEDLETQNEMLAL